jgi:hypothetical protein
MFDLNFISEPGVQNETSDASWSFLSKQIEPAMNGESGSKHSQLSLIHQNSWKNYAFVLLIFGFITIISIFNSRYTKVKPDLVLNQVIDLIVESDYINNLQLAEAIFSTDQVKVTIRSEDFAAIQSLSRGYRMENELPYEMYKKGKYSYLNLIFRWKGNEKSGDFNILQSMADKIVFSKEASINHTEDIFEIQGEASDIISFLLEMAENKQIQKFNLSVSHDDFEQFNLIVQN